MGVVWRACHERGWGFNATVRWSLDGAQDERTGGLGVVWRACHESEVFRATVRWPFDGAQDERTGGLGVGWRACHESGVEEPGQRVAGLACLDAKF